MSFFIWCPHTSHLNFANYVNFFKFCRSENWFNRLKIKKKTSKRSSFVHFPHSRLLEFAKNVHSHQFLKYAFFQARQSCQVTRYHSLSISMVMIQLLDIFHFCIFVANDNTINLLSKNNSSQAYESMCELTLEQNELKD